ncbi:hypothetical protein HDU98_009615 [Podochytrium sp. JEL0797]|nr:hypothetical protein HDU98_009615 [Podochytrium sp. JEL0797]
MATRTVHALPRDIVVKSLPKVPVPVKPGAALISGRIHRSPTFVPAGVTGDKRIVGDWGFLLKTEAKGGVQYQKVRHFQFMNEESYLDGTLRSGAEVTVRGKTADLTEFQKAVIIADKVEVSDKP